MNFSELLTSVMAREGLTQKDVAELCHLSQSSVCRYVSGVTVPSFDTAVQILEKLGYSLQTVSKEEVKDTKNLHKNASGYYDPTAYRAIQNVEKDRDRLMKLLDVIFTICGYAGFHVEGRIPLRDLKTGKIWR